MQHPDWPEKLNAIENHLQKLPYEDMQLLAERLIRSPLHRGDFNLVTVRRCKVIFKALVFIVQCLMQRASEEEFERLAGEIQTKALRYG